LAESRDQFEEAFFACREAAREAFLDALSRERATGRSG
jgi:hypothetical protein